MEPLGVCALQRERERERDPVSQASGSQASPTLPMLERLSGSCACAAPPVSARVAQAPGPKSRPAHGGWRTSRADTPPRQPWARRPSQGEKVERTVKRGAATTTMAHLALFASWAPTDRPGQRARRFRRFASPRVTHPRAAPCDWSISTASKPIWRALIRRCRAGRTCVAEQLPDTN